MDNLCYNEDTTIKDDGAALYNLIDILDFEVSYHLAEKEKKDEEKDFDSNHSSGARNVYTPDGFCHGNSIG